MAPLRLDGVVPAAVTPFTASGELDRPGVTAYVSWLKSIPDITAIVVNAHAGEGTSLTLLERLEVIRLAKAAVGGNIPIVASISGEGTRVVVDEAEQSAGAGADALLVFPALSWLRFGYQVGAPKERFRSIHSATGLPTILFQFPVSTRASYDLPTILDICDLDGVAAIKDGGRDMIRWDTDVPILRKYHPEIALLTCQDEFLLHTMWEADGALIGFASLVPEQMIELYVSARSHDYAAAKARYDSLADLTKIVYHRKSHIESTSALKIGLELRGILPNSTVRPPLIPLPEGTSAEVATALRTAGVEVG